MNPDSINLETHKSPELPSHIFYRDGVGPKSGERVVVAMSGGVDSCVAAAILQEMGCEVIGLTMQLWDYGFKNKIQAKVESEQSGAGEAQSSAKKTQSCCSLSDVHDARRVCDTLGIPHYVVNYEKEFQSGVVDYFADEYARGRTPNPCVLCNSQLKFDHLIEKARSLGAKWVATGHYARMEYEETPQIFRPEDDSKDQTYFLFHLNREYLKNIFFPLAHITKSEAREIASRYGLHTSQKKESQEICFVAGHKYTDFLETYRPSFRGQGGEVKLQKRDETGELIEKKIGEHKGIHYFTVGQRKGLGIAHTRPLFVSRIDASSGTVFVEEAEDRLPSDEHADLYFDISQVNFLNPEHEKQALLGALEAEVAVRYRAKPVACRVKVLSEGRARIWFLEAPKGHRVTWVTPGQAAVLYRGGLLIGGGFIESQQDLWSQGWKKT